MIRLHCDGCDVEADATVAPIGSDDLRFVEPPGWISLRWFVQFDAPPDEHDEDPIPDPGFEILRKSMPAESVRRAEKAIEAHRIRRQLLAARRKIHEQRAATICPECAKRLALKRHDVVARNQIVADEDGPRQADA